MIKKLLLALCLPLTGCAWAGESPDKIPPFPDPIGPAPEEGRKTILQHSAEFWTKREDKEEESILFRIREVCRREQGFILNLEGKKEYYLCVDRLAMPKMLEEFDVK